jgi:hypothetical protein
MNDSRTEVRQLVGGLLAFAGGLLLGIGSFLPWAAVSGGGKSVTARGVDTSLGYTTLAVGLVALGVGVVMTSWVALPEMARTLAAIAILAGVVGCGIGTFEALMTQDSLLDAAARRLAPSLGSIEQARALLDQAVGVGQISFSVGVGVYVVIVGGVVTLAGGIAGLRRLGPPQTADTRALSVTQPAPPAGIEYRDVPTAQSTYGSDPQADLGASRAR